MEPNVKQVSTHLVRQHRRVRRRLPELTAFADRAANGTSAQVQSAARGAVRLLERDVLGQADVEDALLATSSDETTERRLPHLLAEHDSIRTVADRLAVVAESADPRRVDVARLLGGLGQFLQRHLRVEWHTLLPLLAQLDDEHAAPLVRMLPVGRMEHDGSPERLHLPRPFEQVQERLTAVGLPHVGTRLESAAIVAARRVATRLAVPGGGSLSATVKVLEVVSSPRVTLLIGRLDSGDIETVLAPAEFEVMITRDGTGATTLELRHDLVATWPLPADALSRGITAAALNAMVGELALIGLDRELREPFHAQHRTSQ